MRKLSLSASAVAGLTMVGLGATGCMEGEGSAKKAFVQYDTNAGVGDITAGVDGNGVYDATGGGDVVGWQDMITVSDSVGPDKDTAVDDTQGTVDTAIADSLADTMFADVIDAMDTEDVMLIDVNDGGGLKDVVEQDSFNLDTTVAEVLADTTFADVIDAMDSSIVEDTAVDADVCADGDIGVDVPEVPVCGDGVCESNKGEDGMTCAEDCNPCEPGCSSEQLCCDGYCVNVNNTHCSSCNDNCAAQGGYCAYTSAVGHYCYVPEK